MQNVVSLALAAALGTVTALSSACVVGQDADEDATAGEGLGLEDEPTDPLAARVCADGATVAGIDVSKWQGTINWSRVKAAGIEYAFIRVSDGVGSTDPRFVANWDGAGDAGLLRGAYQFFRPGQNVAAQAQIMIDALGGAYTPGDLPPVIDVEADGGLAPSVVASRIRQWVDLVHAGTGAAPIVYTGKYFWRDDVGGPTTFTNPLWIAQYTTQCPDLPAPWATWTFWQHSKSGRIAGIPYKVDLNRFNGTRADLEAFAHR